MWNICLTFAMHVHKVFHFVFSHAHQSQAERVGGGCLVPFFSGSDIEACFECILNLEFAPFHFLSLWEAHPVLVTLEIITWKLQYYTVVDLFSFHHLCFLSLHFMTWTIFYLQKQNKSVLNLVKACISQHLLWCLVLFCDTSRTFREEVLGINFNKLL